MVYIEIALVVNVLIHVLLVKNSSLIMGTKIKKRYLLVSVVLDSIYMYLYCYYPKSINDYRYIFGVLIAIIPNLSLGGKNIFKGTIFYLVQNFLLGGISEILYVASILKWYHIFIVIIIILVIIIIYKELTRNHFNIKNLYYNVKVIDKNKEHYLKGFCDTGNFLTDENYVPVVFINSKYKFGTEVKKITSQSINVKNNFTLYVVDKFYIKINGKYIQKDVYIAYSSINNEVMFGISLLGG